ncbi:MAG: hypothetical protein IKR68_10145 [Lachnospiraceae bacterium]|nr:hypothetical protein [Lachnospiraceae bacterium]
MNTVIYLANKQIQIVEGTASKGALSVKRYYSVEAPEGSIINGIVMDTDSFIPFLAQVWREQHFSPKDVTLVVESTKFMGRTLELPVLGEKKTLEFIDREFSDMGREEEVQNVYSYIKLGQGEGKNIKIYAEAAEPDFISDLAEIFAKAGIKLSAIYSGKSALINFVAKEVSKSHRTFVLIVADIMSFSTVLWVNGSFSYYNSNRCFQAPGTPMYAMDLANSMSQLTQFMKANRIEHELEEIQIAGVHPDDRDMYASAVSDIGINTPVSVFNVAKRGFGTDWNLQSYVHPISGLYGGGKMENMLVQHSIIKKRSKSVGLAAKKYIIALGALALVMLTATVALVLVRLGREGALSRLDAYNNSPEVLFAVAEHDNISERNYFLNQQIEAIKLVEDDMRTFPLGDTDVLKVFDRCALGYADVEYEAFDAESGTITISAEAENVDLINQFIKRLTEERIFSKVDYTGYNWEPSVSKWNIHVTCTLAESAGRGE